MKPWGSNVFLQHIYLSTRFFFLSQVYAVHTPLHASQGVFCGEVSSLRLLSSASPFGSQNGLSIYLFPCKDSQGWEGPCFHPSFVSGASQNHCQARPGVRSARPWGFSRKERLQCPLWSCNLLWSRVYLSTWTTSPWVMKFTNLKSYLREILKDIMRFTVMHLQTLLSLLQNWLKNFFSLKIKKTRDRTHAFCLAAWSLNP